MEASGRAELAERIGSAVLDLVEDLLHAVVATSAPADPGPGDERPLTTREAAAVARRTPETIRSWARSGRLRDVGGEGRALYRRADVEAARSKRSRARPGTETPAGRAERILREVR